MQDSLSKIAMIDIVIITIYSNGRDKKILTYFRSTLSDVISEPGLVQMQDFALLGIANGYVGDT